MDSRRREPHRHGAVDRQGRCARGRGEGEHEAEREHDERRHVGCVRVRRVAATEVAVAGHSRGRRSAGPTESFEWLHEGVVLSRGKE
ncbi:hypothetical protein DB32_003572 [Sandaracinus amylolyticus]|uniref:Uncharacterized protein n=1 Tax=Sandaracinus amylolyticus TaxID=927083 RepID=A0A0F6W3F7_9BACT|nr:hypothetical protein DB32_003572 [Sandaracinus amylolyticus]